MSQQRPGMGMSGFRKKLGRALARGSACAVLIVGVVAVHASSALANSPITFFEAAPTTAQAGGHPNVEFDVKFKARTSQPSTPCDCSDAKNIDVELPTGLVGNPHAVPQCSVAAFASSECPVDSQVGLIDVELGTSPVYNLVPHEGEAGLVGFKAPLLSFPIYQEISSRTGSDYGLNVSTDGIFHLFPIAGFEELLFGVPADPSNDGQRFPFKVLGSYCTVHEDCFNTPSNSPLTPFTENPTSCGVPLSASIEILSYDNGTSEAEYPWPGTTGCDQLSFNPSLFAQPTTQQTDSASGVEINIKVPQLTSPSVPAPSEIKATTVTMPPGFSINPNAADGKTSCSDMEARFGTLDEAQCPEYSKVGSLTLTTSLLPAPVPGSVYIGEPEPGNRYRIFLTANGFGVHVKLAGFAMPDPQTGQLAITFPNLPQTPFEEFAMHFFGSERGLLATPTQCGTYPVVSTFVPWDSVLPDQTSTQFFVLDSGPDGQPCPGQARPFNPSFIAGVADSTAGDHSPFTLKLIRNDGDQNLSAVDVSTPPGFSATLAGIPYCSDAALATVSEPSYSGVAEQVTPSCPAASQIGTAVTGAGAGNHPLYVTGRVYLAGPYKGAPLSLAVITPAVSGPYDLGNSVVRVALEVDPTTAQVTAISDPLPRILQGIPLRLRSIRIDLDRPGFTLNPTNCAPLSVKAKVFGDHGAESNLGSHFQAASCTNLGFSPHLALNLVGGVKRRGHPAIHAVFTTKPGEANARSVSVALPKGELLDNAHIGNVCTRVQFAANNCPAASVLGTAEATTPLLEAPLKGNVYLRSSPVHNLPDIVADLKGQINIELAGRVDTVKDGSLRTTFESVPDAPVSKFSLDLAGGSKGLLVNSHSLCTSPVKATVKMVGQNGLALTTKPTLGISCGNRKKRHRRRMRHARDVR